MPMNFPNLELESQSKVATAAATALHGNGPGCRSAWLGNAIGLLSDNSHRRVQDSSQPRPKRHAKTHPNIAYKG